MIQVIYKDLPTTVNKEI